MKCFPLDATKYEADALGAWFVTRERGVLSADDNFAVIASGSAMSVTLRPGVAWLKRAQHWGTVVWMEEPVTFNLDPADGTLSTANWAASNWARSSPDTKRWNSSSFRTTGKPTSRLSAH